MRRRRPFKPSSGLSIFYGYRLCQVHLVCESVEASYLSQPFLEDGGDDAIGRGPHVEQQIAVTRNRRHLHHTEGKEVAGTGINVRRRGD